VLYVSDIKHLVLKKGVYAPGEKNLNFERPGYRGIMKKSNLKCFVNLLSTKILQAQWTASIRTWRPKTYTGFL